MARDSSQYSSQHIQLGTVSESPPQAPIIFTLEHFSVAFTDSIETPDTHASQSLSTS